MNDAPSYFLMALSGGLFAGAIYQTGRAVWAGKKLWRLYRGNRKANEARAGGSVSLASLTPGNYAALVSATLAFHRAPQAAGSGLGAMGAIGSYSAHGAIPGLGSSPLTMLSAGASFGSGANYPTVRAVTNCRRCGASHLDKEPHACETPDPLDGQVVRTIQTLIANGLAPEEIAEDMGVRLGWRAWRVIGGRVCGLGMGSVAPWPLDAPLLSVCINTDCAAAKAAKCDPICHGSDKPTCRVHAVKTREQLVAEITAEEIGRYGIIIGTVALWGDVIECEGGWLASRAYPLGFESDLCARAYRVASMKAPA